MARTRRGESTASRQAVASNVLEAEHDVLTQPLERPISSTMPKNTTIERPSSWGFIFALMISFAAEAVAHTVASAFILGDLSTISKHDETPFNIGFQIVWKITLMAIMWYSGFDAVDVASLETLLQTPIFILHHFFYDIALLTLVPTITINILAPSLAFLIRPYSAPHTTNIFGSGSRSSIRGLHNRVIINDSVTTVTTSITASVALAVCVVVSLVTIMPKIFILHFTGLRNLAPAYESAAHFPQFTFWLVPAGLAATQFLFRPSEAAVADVAAAKNQMGAASATGVNSVALDHGHFDPTSSGFWAHVKHNVWGSLSSREKTLAGRTLLLSGLVMLETVVNLMNMEGVELIGALSYAGTWAGAINIVGLLTNFVGAAAD